MKTIKNILTGLWGILLLALVAVVPTSFEGAMESLGFLGTLLVILLAFCVFYELGAILGIVNQIKTDK